MTLPTGTISEIFSSLGARLLALENTAPPSGRRTNETVAYGFGRQTASGVGGVPLENPELGLLKLGAEAPVSWVVSAPSPGTPAHWTTGVRTATPVPTGPGATAFLPDTQAVFQITATFADGSTEVSTITVNVLPDTFTLGQSDNFSAIGTSHLSRVDGKAIELAAGINLFGAGTAKLIGTWRFANRTIVRPHDPARIRWPAGWNVRSTAKLTVNDFQTSDSDGTTVTSRMSIGLDGVGNLPTDALIVNRFKHIGSAAYYIAGTNPADLNRSKYLFSIGGQATIEINGAEGYMVRGGATGSNNNVATGVTTNVVFNDLRIRHFWDNGAIPGTGNGSEVWTFNRPRFVSVDRLDTRGVEDSNHADGFQLNTGNRRAIITFNDAWIIQGDGDGLMQHVFGTLAPMVNTGDEANTININGAVFAGSMTAALAVAESKNATMRNIAAILMRPIKPLRDPSIDIISASNNMAFTSRTDQNQGVAGYQAPNVLKRSLFYSNIQNGGVFDTSDGNVALGGLLNMLPDYSPYYNGNPTLLFEAFDWANATWEQIELFVRSALSAKVNGLHKRADGSYNASFNPDGTNATDAPYVG